MAADHIHVEFHQQVARVSDGRIRMVRLHAPKFGDIWFWLDRDRDELQELRPYRLEMFVRRCRG